MNSRERVLCALNHKEPDRIPLILAQVMPVNSQILLPKIIGLFWYKR